MPLSPLNNGGADGVRVVASLMLPRLPLCVCPIAVAAAAAVVADDDAIAAPLTGVDVRCLSDVCCSICASVGDAFDSRPPLEEPAPLLEPNSERKNWLASVDSSCTDDDSFELLRLSSSRARKSRKFSG